MPVHHLTDRSHRRTSRALGEQRQCDYGDPTKCVALVCALYAGKKAFVVRYRVNARLRRLTPRSVSGSLAGRRAPQSRA